MTGGVLAGLPVCASGALWCCGAVVDGTMLCRQGNHSLVQCADLLL